MNITFMPAVIGSYEQAYRWKTAPIGKELAAILEAKGVKIITWMWQSGGIASRGKPILKPEDAKGTVDPLSAVMLITSGVMADAANPCGVVAPVFDGRRRYNIEMSKARDVDIRMDNGLYAGKGEQCDIRYHQLAGFRPRVLKDNENFPMIHAWIARFPSAVAGRDYTVPVRVWADTKYGVMAVLAISVRVDGQAPKRVKS